LEPSRYDSSGTESARLEERAVAGLHEAVVREIGKAIPTPGDGVDLGAGSGAVAQRLQQLGWNMIAVERDADSFRAAISLVSADLADSTLAVRLGRNRFHLVVSTEVIEHMESPLEFLRLVRALLRDDGVAVLSTPNVDNALARLKFLWTDRIRMMDSAGDPTHVSPIFWDLLVRQYLPRAGLTLESRVPYPERGFLASRAILGRLGMLLARLIPGEANLGDSHILILGPSSKAGGSA